MENEKLVSYTWLPVFPGFYYTIFDNDKNSDYEEEYIRENIEPVELAECMIEHIYESETAVKFYKEYQDSVARQCVVIIWDNLKRLGYVESIEFEEISSPREYNFINDSINVKIIFSAENIKKIKTVLQEHADEWKEYLIRNYKSYDGFISYHSYYPEDEEWNVDTALHDTHNIGSILQFICEQNDITDATLYTFVEDNVSLDTDMLKRECIDKGWYVPKSICRDWFRSVKARIKLQYSFRRYVSLLNPAQYILETPKQRYIFTIYKGEFPANNAFIIKRLFQIFIFAKLKEEKKHGNKNNN